MTALARKVLPYLRPCRGAFVLALVQLLVINALELVKPWPLKIVIDDVLGGRSVPGGFGAGWSPETLLLFACLALVTVHVVLGALHFLNLRTGVGIGQRMVWNLQGDLYAHLQRLSLAFHTRRKVGDLLYRVTADTYAIQTLATNALFPVVSASLFLVGMVVVMARLDPVLTLLALAVCPVLMLALAGLNARIAASAQRARERESGVYALVQGALSSIRVIQAFTRERDEHRRFMAASRASLAAMLDLYTLQTVYSWVVGVVLAVGTALVVWAGARHVMAGSLTLGELVVFTAYLSSLYQPVNMLLQTYASIHGARAAAHRVFEILAVEHDLPDGDETFEPGGAPGGARGDLAWENVTFEYVPGQPALEGIDLRVRRGEHVAIVGATGAGKSTLVSLVPRFYDVTCGRVTVDGIDVRDFQLASLRRQVSMVLQPPLVFPITIRENIAYGRPEAPDDEIVAAARLAAADEFIMALPQGYDTLVGEGGATISEGEKLRLTIARAILRDAPILILDEPTASLDAETEALVMHGLGRLTTGRTCLVIAHRLSTARAADRIVVVRAGRIVEEGTFAELIDRGGAFASLYQAQFTDTTNLREVPR
jgi:ATP-binding cassette subfamily B protein/subfamily B ATP-binding cassette protein MsbA